MKIAILDDYQRAVPTLDCFARLAGHDVTVFTDTLTDPDALAARLAPFEGLLLIRERTRFPAGLLKRLPKLKALSQTGKPGPHIDSAACTELGVAVLGGTGSPIAPAELTWALIMASMRHVALEDRRLREGRWQTTLGRVLHGRTLGVWGYGNIGKLVAGYGRAFGMNVIAYGREGTLARAAADGIKCVSRETLFAEADVVTIHLRLAPETRGIVTRADFARMKPDALWVNTSRAELVAAAALEGSLKEGRPGFAAVDVFESEPVLGGNHPLLKSDNVVATPHLGYVEKDSYEFYLGTAIDNLVAFAKSNP